MATVTALLERSHTVAAHRAGLKTCARSTADLVMTGVIMAGAACGALLGAALADPVVGGTLGTMFGGGLSTLAGTSVLPTLHDGV